MLIKYLPKTLNEVVHLSNTDVLFIDSIGDVPAHEVTRLLGIPGYVKYESPAIPEPVSEPVSEPTITITETSAPITKPRATRKRK